MRGFVLLRVESARGLFSTHKQRPRGTASGPLLKSISKVEPACETGGRNSGEAFLLLMSRTLLTTMSRPITLSARLKNFLITFEYLGGRPRHTYIIALQAEVNGETLECKLRGTRVHYRPEEERMDWIAADA